MHSATIPYTFPNTTETNNSLRVHVPIDSNIPADGSIDAGEDMTIKIPPRVYTLEATTRSLSLARAINKATAGHGINISYWPAEGGYLRGLSNGNNMGFCN